MSDKTELRVDWCSHEAAKYAVMHWHYSKTMPMPPLLKIGVWEDGKFIGVVLFGRGNTPTLGRSYGLEMLEVCELVRVALASHIAPVSQIVAKTIKLLQVSNPGLRLIVSFADPAHQHNGAIYQAMNWTYTGESEPSWQWFHEGRWKHNREITSGAFGGPRKVKDYAMLPKRLPLGKHRYLYPLDRAMRKQIAPLAQPYPKRELCGQSVEGDTVGDQPTGASSILAARS